MAPMADKVLQLATRPPLPNSVVWSEDNQIAVVTLSTIYILTPHLRNGSVEPSRTSINAAKSLRDDNPLIPQLQKAEKEDIRAVHIWKDAFHRAVWSPSGCSRSRGCLLATVGTLFSVLLWAPVADPATSAWEQVCNLSEAFQEYLLQGRALDKVTGPEIAKLSVVSIGWSPLCIDSSGGELSLIALGSKDGSITLWRYDRENASVSHVASCAANDAWVTNLDWSTWSDIGNQQSCAYLGSSCSDGSASVWKVTITRSKTFQCDVEKTTDLFPADSRLISVLNFLQPSLTRGASARLAVTKGRKLLAWFGSNAQPGSNETEHSASTLVLPQTMAVTGVVWGLDGDELRLYTADGQCFIVSISDHRHLALVEDNTVDLHREIRQVPPDLDDEGGNASPSEDEPDALALSGKGERMTFHGAATSASSMFDAVVFHTTAIADLAYYTEKSRTSFIVLRSMFSQSGDEFENAVHARFDSHLRSPDLLRHYTPHYLMWDVLQYCMVDISQWPNLDDAFVTRFLSSVRDFYITYEGGEGQAAVDADDVTAFHQKLFRNPNITAVRLMIFLCKALIAEGASKPALRARFKTMHSSNLKLLTAHYISQATALVHSRIDDPEFSLTDSDIRSLALLTDHTLLNHATYSHPPTPFTHLPRIHAHIHTTHGVSLYPAGFEETLQHAAATTNQPDRGRGDLDGLIGAREQCVACSADVGLGSLARGVCRNGHGWDRCMATFAILGITGVRTCTGCNKKIRAANQSESTSALALPHIIDQCLYCGSRFRELDNLLEV
ncbi:transcription factor IIIC subunit delta N-term-domain-containing protein [Powellomyces hirtus]|nr:transcription factor IIIC subunit delta N-term-domain-containing protein [Powellomyces hirtus]